MGKQKPGIHPRQCSLETNDKVNTFNVQTKLLVSREMSMYTSPRKVSPMGFDRLHLSPLYTGQ